MCCFGFRVFLLIFATLFSFILHRFIPNIPVIFFYFLISNLIALTIFSLFFKSLLPSFVKPAAVHYFSAIGGFIMGLIVAIFNTKKAGIKFIQIEFIIAIFWILFIGIVIFKFDFLQTFFTNFLGQ